MKLFGIEIDGRSREEIFKDIVKRIDSSQRVFVVTANAVIMLKVKENPKYRKAVESADLVVPDGSGIVLVSKLKGKRISKYPGVELARDLVSEGSKKKWKFYLLGARERVVSKLAKDLKQRGVNVCGYHHGYFDGKGPVEEISEKKPDIILVAMGVPKQELWIYENMEKFRKGLFIGVGGTFDVMAGFKKRAPKWMVKAGLEWLYRIFQDPKRWKVLFRLFRFFIYALLDRG